jgi:hypothetical protein
MFDRMTDGGLELVILSTCLFLVPYFLGLARQNIRPRPINWISFSESILLLSSEVYITINFWFRLHGGYADLEFDTAKIIQAAGYLFVLAVEYVAVNALQRQVRDRKDNQ